MKLKRLFFIGLGLSTRLLINVIFFRLIAYNMIFHLNSEILFFWKIFFSSIVTLISIAGFELIIYLISNWYRENDSVIFYYFFKTLKKNKVIHHEHLGDFLLLIRDNELELYKQNWFLCQYINSYHLTDDTDLLSDQIKSSLNRLYKDKIYEDEKKKKNDDKINKIMSWDGHLDKKTRRDDKLGKLGIK